MWQSDTGRIPRGVDVHAAVAPEMTHAKLSLLQRNPAPEGTASRTTGVVIEYTLATNGT